MARAAVLATALVVAACAFTSDEPRAAGGRYLVYTRAIGMPNQAVWIGDVEGRRMRRLTRGGYGLVSPDGAKIAVSRRAGIFTIRPDGRGGHFVARGRLGDWLSDSRHLLAIQQKAFVRIDLQDGSVDVIDPREVTGWSVSPDGQSIAYEVYRQRPPSGECWFDVYTARIDGTARRRLTTGGRSSSPVWGSKWIAYAYRPPGTGCFKPRIWRMDADGQNKAPVMRTLPMRFGTAGYYGVSPESWVRGRPLILATVVNEWGREVVLVDTRDGRARKPDLDPRPRAVSPMPFDWASSDGRYVVGAGCGAEFPCTIAIYSVLTGRWHEVATGRVAYPHWNR
jgi:hypothetical protein